MKTWKKMISMASLVCISMASFGVAAAEAASARDTQAASEYERVFGNEAFSHAEQEPELTAVMNKLIHSDIASASTLTDTQRQLVTMVVLAANQNQPMLRRQTEGALRVGVKPVEIREAIYQVAPYIGLPKAWEALDSINAVFRDHHIPLPLPEQGTVTDANRLQKGLDIQVGIYGDRIIQRRETAPADEKVIQEALTAYCFGDTYTRGTLDLPMRELLTMSVIASLGGAESQLKGHMQGNLTVGNTRETLAGAITEMMPYIGFPRTLNALRILDEVAPAVK